MTDIWNLHGSTRRPLDAWPELHAITHDWTAAWADNHGFHIDAMPETAPVSTHLWAWTRGSWLRARLDTPHWWAAMLTLGKRTLDEPWTRPTPLQQPLISQITHWAADEGRVRQFRLAAGEDPRGGKTFQLLPNLKTPTPFIGHPDSVPDHLKTP